MSPEEEIEYLKGKLQRSEDECHELRVQVQQAYAARDHEREQKEMRHQAWLKANAGKPQVMELLRKIKSARTEGGCSTGEAISKSECWAREALAILDPQPVPMCKPDPVGDLFPPARGETRKETP